MSDAANTAAPEGPENTAMRVLLARNRRRRKIRTWIGIGSIIPGLVALVLVVKLFGMYVFADQAVRSFLRLEFGTTVAMAKWQQPLNWFEPYKADYNLGTGLAEIGELDDARSALERALPLAPGLESCAVRYNLATVIERQGDRATGEGEGDTGQDLYREALDVLGAANDGCFEDLADASSPDVNRSTPESIELLAERILRKLKQDENQQSPGQTPPGQTPPDGGGDKPDSGLSDDELERLKEQLQQGTQERQEREQMLPGDGFGDGGFGGGTDQPW